MGKSHVRHFVAEGARVVFGDVLDDKGAAVAAGLERAVLPVHPPRRDQRGAVGGAVATAVEAFGRLDVLVNNAGVLKLRHDRRHAAGRLPARHGGECGRLLARHEGGDRADEAAGGGSIINISSVEGFTGAAGLSAYSASKFAVRGMTKAAARELASSASGSTRFTPAGSSPA